MYRFLLAYSPRPFRYFYNHSNIRSLRNMSFIYSTRPVVIRWSSSTVSSLLGESKVPDIYTLMALSVTRIAQSIEKWWYIANSYHLEDLEFTILFLSSRIALYWIVRDTRIVIGPGLFLSAPTVCLIRKRGALWRKGAARWGWRCSSQINCRPFCFSFESIKYHCNEYLTKYVQLQIEQLWKNTDELWLLFVYPAKDSRYPTSFLAFQQTNRVTTIKQWSWKMLV